MRQPTLRAALRAANTATVSATAPCTSTFCSAAARHPAPILSSLFFSTPARTPVAAFSTSRPRASPESAAAAAATTTTTATPALSQILFPSSATTAVGVTNTNPSVYATVYIHGRPYLVTPGDSLRLPFLMAGVQPGDELRLDRVGVVGSRTVTAVATAAEAAKETEAADDVTRATVGAPVVASESIPGASVRAVVLGVETEPERTLMKKKRRSRRKRTFKSKHYYTVLRIKEVVLE